MHTFGISQTLKFKKLSGTREKLASSSGQLPSLRPHVACLWSFPAYNVDSLGSPLLPGTDLLPPAVQPPGTVCSPPHLSGCHFRFCLRAAKRRGHLLAHSAPRAWAQRRRRPSLLNHFLVLALWSLCCPTCPPISPLTCSRTLGGSPSSPISPAWGEREP